MQVLPCRHGASTELLERCRVGVVVGQSTGDAFSQLNERLRQLWICCPTCHQRVCGIQNFSGFYSAVELAPIEVSGRRLTFKRVELINIEQGGQDAIDGGETYRRLATLANDFDSLVSIFGPVAGRLLWSMPTRWKAEAYIEAFKKTQGCAWVIIDGFQNTVGNLSLTKIDNAKYDLQGDLASRKLFNIGVTLHSSYQRKGIVNDIAQTLLQEIPNLKIGIEGFFISTRPENQAVNHIAQKLNFRQIKTLTLPIAGTCGLQYIALTTVIWVRLVP